ncbi:MAG: LysR family transcriptional regulator [Rhodanobacteraceae bacterium]|nr:LysR family transcriptional regulator [Rhodanobacteraceae bacterium]
MFDWNDVQVFLAIARGGSLAAAARTLKVNHSTVFRRLNTFEDALGVRLFERMPTGYALTPEGESIRAEAEAVGTNVHALERRSPGVTSRCAVTFGSPHRTGSRRVSWRSTCPTSLRVIPVSGLTSKHRTRRSISVVARPTSRCVPRTRHPSTWSAAASLPCVGGCLHRPVTVSVWAVRPTWANFRRIG